MSQNLCSRGDNKWEIMQEHCIGTSSNICFGYLLESPHWGDSNKYPKHMFYEEIRTKQSASNILSIKDFLQQQIHYNGNIFGNKCCCCNKGSLYNGAEPWGNVSLGCRQRSRSACKAIVWSGTLYSILYFWKWTAKALIRLCGCKSQSVYSVS